MIAVFCLISFCCGCWMTGYMLRDRLHDAEMLIATLEAFIMVAREYGRGSGAVDKADLELQKYKKRWK